jgi:hypothetical protein
LRRSVFNSTPLRVKPTEAKKSSMTASYTLHPTGRSANRFGIAADNGSKPPSTCNRARSCRFCLRVLPRCIGGPMTLRCPLGSLESLGVLFSWPHSIGSKPRNAVGIGRALGSRSTNNRS